MDVVERRALAMEEVCSSLQEPLNHDRARRIRLGCALMLASQDPRVSMRALADFAVPVFQAAQGSRLVVGFDCDGLPIGFVAWAPHQTNNEDSATAPLFRDGHARCVRVFEMRANIGRSATLLRLFAANLAEEVESIIYGRVRGRFKLTKQTHISPRRRHRLGRAQPRCRFHHSATAIARQDLRSAERLGALLEVLIRSESPMLSWTLLAFTLHVGTPMLLDQYAVDVDDTQGAAVLWALTSRRDPESGHPSLPLHPSEWDCGEVPIIKMFAWFGMSQSQAEEWLVANGPSSRGGQYPANRSVA